MANLLLPGFLLLVFNLSCFKLQVEKLQILSESLANSTSQAEKRILDHRFETIFQSVMLVSVCSSLCV
jgi:hypothetical protein